MQDSNTGKGRARVRAEMNLPGRHGWLHAGQPSHPSERACQGRAPASLGPASVWQVAWWVLMPTGSNCHRTNAHMTPVMMHSCIRPSVQSRRRNGLDGGSWGQLGWMFWAWLVLSQLPMLDALGGVAFLNWNTCSLVLSFIFLSFFLSIFWVRLFTSGLAEQFLILVSWAMLWLSRIWSNSAQDAWKGTAQEHFEMVRLEGKPQTAELHRSITAGESPSRWYYTTFCTDFFLGKQHFVYLAFSALYWKNISSNRLLCQ